VFRNRRGAWDGDEAIEKVVAEAKSAFPGSKVQWGKKRRGARWRASIVFKYPVSREVLAEKLGKVPIKNPKNGRVHLLAGHRKPRTLFEPLSAAHANAREALSEAQDQLLTDYFQYRVDEPEDEMDDEQIKRAVARIDRRKKRRK